MGMSRQTERRHALKLSLDDEIYFTPFSLYCPSLTVRLKLVQL